MSSSYNKDKPYGIAASFNSAYVKLPPQKPTHLQAHFDYYYLEEAVVIAPLGFNGFRSGSLTAHNYLSFVSASGISTDGLGVPSAELMLSFVVGNGFLAEDQGKPTVTNMTTKTYLKGIDSLSIGTHQVSNFNKTLLPYSFRSSQVGTPLLYNLAQYRYLSGYDASRYGNAYLMGGVKYLTLSGISSNAFGPAVVTNTTANQTITPGGINSAIVPAPTVSPRILYARGIDSLAMGSPNARDPALKPLGELHTKYGTPTVWFHTRPLAPAGILAYESGYLRIADPTQFVLAPSLVESAIFGDTAIKNTSTKIGVPSIDDGSFSDYTTVTNSNRRYEPKGINSLAIGAALVANKTPSIFVGGIKPFDTGTPAIGHAVRTVQPTGFDHLLFGRPVLTKTPELKVSGYQSSVVSPVWISHKNRAIDLIQKGINSQAIAPPTVWFGQRPIKPTSWQTARYGQPELTHQLRLLPVQGFRRDAYGMAWVSQGTRSLEPKGIYQDFPSSHMVGSVQIISPAGYIATLWGERIIPLSRPIQPLGFTGLWGDAFVDLHTKHIAPVGFISVGQQPADRWGDIVVYNKLQHIVQEFDINSELVPPKWSDWTAIANRNIQMNVTGLSSQRFGYSQIDNNAAPLLPEAIKPPPITIGMIAHAVRTLAPEAIAPIPMSDWGVIHNSGRVIAPPGVVHTGSGLPVVANTRRYYTGVGRLDSLEAGTPMIAYRIRTIDIERRYSIEPPQIELPTIDLHTKYIGFNGYETAKYGLPSLSIHFNIIGPSWRHRDDFGYGAVRNVTPELQVGAFDSQEFGQASVRTQWRHVKAQGDTATLFGSTVIADRTQNIKPTTWQDGGSSQKHTVIKTGAPPYTPQNIWLQNESNPNADGFGIKPSSTPSNPGLNQNVIYHRGHNSQKFGDTFIWSNNLYIEIGISTKNIEVGPSVRNQNRFLDVKGIDNTIVVSDKLGVTPFYIKPRSFNQPYDEWGSRSDDKFGNTRVTNQHRTIYPQGHTSSRFGMGASVTLQTRYIIPPTIRGFAMGFPEIPFTLKTINLNDYGFLSEVHGATKVERPPYLGTQTISARGISALSMGGGHRVELLNREFTTKGHNSLAMGRSKQDDTPYMWQGLRVGEFVPMKIGAGDTSVFGETVIGLRIKEIPLEGFVAFRSEYEPSRFKDRMKVIGSITGSIPTQGVTAGGIDSEAMGSVGVKLGQHFIKPDGNADQFRKSSYSAEFGAPTISG